MSVPQRGSVALFRLARFGILGIVILMAMAMAPAPIAAATQPTCDGRTATWVGTEGDDTFTDTVGTNDVIVALGGSDRIDVGAGDDVVCAGGGDDVVYGGSGADRIFGEGGNDFLYGGGGNDAIWGGDGDDVIEGNSGSDQLFGEAGNDELWGSSCTPIVGMEHFCRTPPSAGSDQSAYADLFTSTRLLRQGSAGSDVTALQQALTDLGFSPGSIDGKFGPLTAAAVRAFQTAHNLAVDGVVGTQTRAALAEALGTLPSDSGSGNGSGGSGSAIDDLGTRMLRLGSRGDDVAALQQILSDLGFSPGPIDGVFGRLTDAAVRAFQTAHGLVADGIVGPQTRAALAGDAGTGDALDGGADFDTCNSPNSGTACESIRGLRAGAPLNASAAEEWRDIVTQAFTERGLQDQIENALAIVACESLADPFITTPSSPDGAYVVGLFQHKDIYWVARSAAAGLPGGSILDPLTNARVAAWLVWVDANNGNPHGPWAQWNGCGPLILSPPDYIP
jgi:peptidoglycan hydrolase-like protein with peptidoglycan-binding domain